MQFCVRSDERFTRKNVHDRGLVQASKCGLTSELGKQGDAPDHSAAPSVSAGGIAEPHGVPSAVLSRDLHCSLVLESHQHPRYMWDWINGEMIVRDRQSSQGLSKLYSECIIVEGK